MKISTLTMLLAPSIASAGHTGKPYPGEASPVANIHGPEYYGLQDMSGYYP